MTGSADDRIMWLAGLLCRPTRREAAHAVTVRAKATAGFDAAELLQNAGTILIDDRNERLREFGNRVRATDPVLALAFKMIALSTDDSAATAHIVPGAIGLLCSADGDTSEALRVWDDVARGKYIGDDFFELAEMYWRGEMQFIVAAGPGAAMRDRYQHPALTLLMHSRWDAALSWLHGASADVAQRWRLDDVMACSTDRGAVASVIADLVDDLYATGTPSAGALALAWQTADPRKPHSFSFLPQLQCAIDNADLEAEDDADVRERIRIWWRAAEGEWTDSKFSVFRITAIETAIETAPGDDLPDLVKPFTTLTSDELTQALGLPAGPTLVVMPQHSASKLNNFHAQYKDLVDAPLPLIVVRDVARIRAALHAEFPHAVAGVDLLLRDLREAKPTRLAPICLVGSPGCGKSRMVRRLADFLRVYVYRYDAASSADSQFGGTGKAWSNTEPSVPARAVAQSKTANPTVLIDEIDKAAARNWNGRLWDALLPFLDRETAGRYRDQSLDCELDLSMVSYVATANDATKLPSPLRDRFRIINIPAPTLQHLPALAAQVMRDLAIEDESRQADAPLAGDELAVIAKAWSRAGFSMRALQKIVGATLEARDSHAMRH
jgi:hypothetical protein